MTSELRPAEEVWDDAIAAWAADTIDTRQAAAAVIEADREAVRAEQAAEIERVTLRLAECSAAGSTMRQTIEELHAEREKLKALAETLAGALEPFAEEWDEREFLAQRHWSFYREASKAIAEYKEATNV